jgi:5-hydroxyisourate hydrolase-like protein (transthyretin family)
MYTSMYTKRSQISSVWIAITALALFTVIGSVSFDNIKNVYAAKDLNVKVSIDDDDIEKGNTQQITVMVTEDGNSKDKISGADVKLTVYPPETDSTTAKDETDDDGKANFDVKIADDAEYGTYEVEVKVSKDGFNTKTEDSSFEVTGSRDNDNEDNNGGDGHENDTNNEGDDSNKGHDSDSGNSDDGESNDQALSQGNACGNGVLSTNILCQNVANQLQGDGNAINIIAVQNGGGDEESELEKGISNPPLASTSSSSVPPTQQSNQQSSSLISGSTNDDSPQSIIDQYEQARLDHAIQTRLNYLR